MTPQTFPGFGRIHSQLWTTTRWTCHLHKVASMNTLPLLQPPSSKCLLSSHHSPNNSSSRLTATIWKGPYQDHPKSSKNNYLVGWNTTLPHTKHMTRNTPQNKMSEQVSDSNCFFNFFLMKNLRWDLKKFWPLKKLWKKLGNSNFWNDFGTSQVWNILKLLKNNKVCEQINFLTFWIKHFERWIQIWKFAVGLFEKLL